MRRSFVLLVLTSWLLAACAGLGSPTPVSLTPTPPAVFSPPFSNDAVQLAWFYKPPDDGNLAAISQYFDFYILTQNDEATRDMLRAQGVTAPFLQYFRFDAIHDPGSCTESPRGNQVAYMPGDFCTISTQHPDWFLLDESGERITSGRNYLMDPGSEGWREFWLKRAMQSQQTKGWDGVFLDNVEASLSKRESRGALPQKYPDDASYQAAVKGFLEYIYTAYFQPQNRPLFANIIALSNADIWFEYLPYLDGAMEEAFAVSWDDYKSTQSWEADMNRAEQTQALGKRMVLVAQGTRDDTGREQFAYASYLLITNPGTAAFRYTNDEAYGETWLYSNYLLDLGKPLGQRYYKGGAWRRDFANGTVTVYPDDHTATITATP